MEWALSHALTSGSLLVEKITIFKRFERSLWVVVRKHPIKIYHQRYATPHNSYRLSLMGANGGLDTRSLPFS